MDIVQYSLVNWEDISAEDPLEMSAVFNQGGEWIEASAQLVQGHGYSSFLSLQVWHSPGQIKQRSGDVHLESRLLQTEVRLVPPPFVLVLCY